MGINTTDEEARRRTVHLRHRLAERLVPACVVLVLLIEMTGRYRHLGAPVSVRAYSVFLAIWAVLILILVTMRQRHPHKARPRLALALVIVAVAFAALMNESQFGWFVAGLAIMGAWLAWHMLLAVALELNTRVDLVTRWVEEYDTPAFVILMVELQTGVLTASESMTEAELGTVWVATVLIIGFLVSMVATLLMIYPGSFINHWRK